MGLLGCAQARQAGKHAMACGHSFIQFASCPATTNPSRTFQLHARLAPVLLNVRRLQCCCCRRPCRLLPNR